MSEESKIWHVPTGIENKINCLPVYSRSSWDWGCYKPEDIRVRWLIGGRLVSTDQTLRHTFEEPGTYWVTGKIYDKNYKLLVTVVEKVIAESGPPWSPELLQQNPLLLFSNKETEKKKEEFGEKVIPIGCEICYKPIFNLSSEEDILVHANDRKVFCAECFERRYL